MNSVSIPTMEPDRQYYFMNQCKTLVLEKKAALNRPLTYNIQTFGCQMNSHDSEKLKGIMKNIHDNSAKAAEEAGFGYDLVAGANIAGFKKVAEAMMAEGIL